MDFCQGRQHANQRRRGVVSIRRPSLTTRVLFHFLGVLLFLASCDGFLLPVLSSSVAGKAVATKVKVKLARPKRQSWDARFEELKTFKDRYGHANVPQLPRQEIGREYKELATFCRNVRSQYKYRRDPSKAHLSHLTDERIAKLESIGFVWDANRAAWQRRFRELARFHKTFGHCSVSQEWEERYPGLRAWVTTQRRRYRVTIAQKGAHKHLRTISNEEIRLLESIGFDWEPFESRWWKKFDELKAFHQSHGHFRIPRSSKKYASLYSYVQYLKRCCREYVIVVSVWGTCEGVKVGGLCPKRLEALRSVSFCWLPNPGAPLEKAPDDIFL